MEFLSRRQLVSWSLLLLLLFAVPLASAESVEREFLDAVARSIHDINAGDKSSGAGAPIETYCVENPLHRAGHPECVKRGAVASNNGRYGGYYVGGGLPLLGEGPCPNHDGTWGWDYVGLIPKRVALNWSHGRRRQGGTGAYKTEGPKLRHE